MTFWTPNLYPIDTDNPVDDLLTGMSVVQILIMRPVVPYEESTYAVVLTNRLVGEDGQPIQSPWKYVHHLDQNEELAPLTEAMSNLGMSIDDIAFAWSFSTGRVTGDLVDVRRGLYGEGPFKKLATEFPAGITNGHETHNLEGENPYALPLSHLGNTLSTLGL